LDCNVLVSARLSPEGASAQLLRAAAQGRFELIVSVELLGELTDVLARERFRRWFSAEEAHAFVAALQLAARFVNDPPAEVGITADPDDDYLVALARAAHADYLVSGDRHLTQLPDPDPPVLTPRAFLELLDLQGQ
jgi:uncharacterized protein